MMKLEHIEFDPNLFEAQSNSEVKKQLNAHSTFGVTDTVNKLEHKNHLHFELTPNPFEAILDIEVKKQLNAHSTFRVRGIMSETVADTFIETIQENQPITFSLKGKDRPLFSGILSNVNHVWESDLSIVTIEATSFTALMDIKKEYNSYQDPAATYFSIFKYRTSLYPNSDFMDMATDGKEIVNLLIEYHETDWCFLKRLASHFNTVLLPDDSSNGVKYFIGLPMSQAGELVAHKYRVIKNLHDAAIFNRNGLAEYTDVHATRYEVTSDQIYELGHKLIFKNREWYIEKATYRLEQSVLMNTYILCDEVGTKIPKQYNDHIRGLSLLGNVLAVEKDTIELLLDIDLDNPIVGKRWFMFSTVYSSPDGAGWYCMPEPGDRIRVVCPDRDEANSFSASAVHLPSSDPEKRVYPQYKALHTKYGKQINFKPDRIELFSNENTYIHLIDDDGIIIKTDKKIVLEAAEEISIDSTTSSVTISAADTVELKQASAIDAAEKVGSVVVNQDVIMSGDEVKIE